MTDEKLGEGKFQRATFAAGCFWGVEQTFRQIEGVVDTEVGYTGGEFEKPTYNDVCSGQTGHAESVEVIYNPELISYPELLDVFWKTHDPTTLNRQGPDVGEQYRSVIFYHNPEQKEAAINSKKELESSGRYRNPVVTQILPAEKFWTAEEYHQRYLEKRGRRFCGL
ncbi:peptide-methionine (S)-S-oxide reductase MsrA [Methanobacterium aggregans]|uniref:peptide-methionine (S)-S-oxide reductase MsrA n=1 Tax=Methanobacterium aggregans TaxID=1615586 RepID=UPI001AE74FAD|nr:peptide-methionine (S)-S-oxide reductase MsrA [Methanobacterium aggregans]MBP2046956.1 peptide-methionine (S)-S-oxide reductase [Methanobacterium aggregans]